MTPILQLTDTMSAKMSKEECKFIVTEQKRFLRRQSISRKKRCAYRFGKRQMLQCTKGIFNYLTKKSAKDHWIVKGLRQMGTLAYRPDYEKGKLVRCDDEPCCQQYPLGAGGKVQAGWLDDRFNWLDEDSVTKN